MVFYCRKYSLFFCRGLETIDIVLCHPDGLSDNGGSLAQHVRRQASSVADAIENAPLHTHRLIAQDFIEQIVAESLHPDRHIPAFLQSFLRKCTTKSN